MDYLKELFKLDEINSILKQHLSETGNKIDNVNFDSYSVEKLEEGIGYLGQHYNLKIKFKSEKSAEIREIYFFVKVATENQQKYLEEIFVFFKETNLYRHILSAHPGFSQVVPRFYQTSAENVIVLENLMEKGYKLFENDESILDLEHLMAALKALGKFHAASVNFECETGMSLLKKFPEYLVENSYRNDPNGLRKYRLENAIKVFQLCIPEIPFFKDSPGLDEIVQIWPELMRKIYDLCTLSTQYRNVLLHGDLWRNNILFKYGENDECLNIKGSSINSLTFLFTDSSKPMECKFVDFQFSRYGPAALDVMTLIILTTYRDFREEHMENLLNFYYANFLAHITHKNIPIESFDVFRESCEYFTLAGLIEKSLFTHYPPELPKDLTSHIQIDYSGDNYIRNFPFELARIAYHSDDNYRKRLDDVVFEVVEKFIEFD